MKVLPLSLLRLFLLQCTMTLILTLTMQDAYAQRGGRGGRGGNNGPIAQPGSSYISLNQYMYEGDKIKLHQQLDLSQADSLAITAQSSSWNAALELKLNRQTIQVIQLSSYMQTKQVMLPQLQLGDKLILKVQGQAYVQSVEAKKHYGPGSGQGQNERFVAHLHGQLTASTTLKVKQLINQQNGRGVLQGKKIKKVVLVASSRRGRAQATLLINGQAVGWSQTIPTQKTRLQFHLDGRYSAQQVRTIQIQINGRAVTLNKVVVVAKQRGHSGGGMNSVGIQVNQSFYGSQRVQLANLIGYNRVNMNVPVRKLIIKVQGQGNVMVNGGGMRLGSITAMGGYSSNQTIHVNGAASVNDIKMRVSGNLTIKSITIQY